VVTVVVVVVVVVGRRRCQQRSKGVDVSGFIGSTYLCVFMTIGRRSSERSLGHGGNGCNDDDDDYPESTAISKTASHTRR